MNITDKTSASQLTAEDINMLKNTVSTYVRSKGFDPKDNDSLTQAILSDQDSGTPIISTSANGLQITNPAIKFSPNKRYHLVSLCEVLDSTITLASGQTVSVVVKDDAGVSDTLPALTSAVASCKYVSGVLTLEVNTDESTGGKIDQADSDWFVSNYGKLRDEWARIRTFLDNPMVQPVSTDIAKLDVFVDNMSTRAKDSVDTYDNNIMFNYNAEFSTQSEIDEMTQRVVKAFEGVSAVQSIPETIITLDGIEHKLNFNLKYGLLGNEHELMAGEKARFQRFNGTNADPRCTFTTKSGNRTRGNSVITRTFTFPTNCVSAHLMLRIRKQGWDIPTLHLHGNSAAGTMMLSDYPADQIPFHLKTFIDGEVKLVQPVFEFYVKYEYGMQRNESSFHVVSDNPSNPEYDENGCDNDVAASVTLGRTFEMCVASYMLANDSIHQSHHNPTGMKLGEANPLISTVVGMKPDDLNGTASGTPMLSSYIDNNWEDFYILKNFTKYTPHSLTGKLIAHTSTGSEIDNNDMGKFYWGLINQGAEQGAAYGKIGLHHAITATSPTADSLYPEVADAGGYAYEILWTIRTRYMVAEITGKTGHFFSQVSSSTPNFPRLGVDFTGVGYMAGLYSYIPDGDDKYVIQTLTNSDIYELVGSLDGNATAHHWNTDKNKWQITYGGVVDSPKDLDALYVITSNPFFMYDFMGMNRDGARYEEDITEGSHMEEYFCVDNRRVFTPSIGPTNRLIYG